MAFLVALVQISAKERPRNLRTGASSPGGMCNMTGIFEHPVSDSVSFLLVEGYLVTIELLENYRRGSEPAGTGGPGFRWR